MPKYSVMIEGRNFPARIFEDGETDMGFIALRHVEAATPEQAELAAVQMIREEYQPLMGERQAGDPSPTMHLEEILELTEFPEQIATTGASWFPMEKD